MARSIGPEFAKHQFQMFADNTAEGEQARRANAGVEARSTAIYLGITGDGEMKLREVFTSQWAAAHDQIGPLVRNGLGTSDIPAVLEALKVVWADADRQMRDVCATDDQYKRWQNFADGNRKRLGTTLDDIKAQQGK